MSGRLGGVAVDVTDLEIPKAGFSNETIMATVVVEDGPSSRTDDIVLRIEPTSHQLFLAPDALRQAAVMLTLAPHVAVPEVLLTESDPTFFGAPFYVMRRVRGNVTPDIPTWHSRGWATRLDDAERSRLHDNGLRELVALHAIDTSGSEFDLLANPGEGTALECFVGWLHRMYEWCEPVRLHDADILDEAMRFVLDEMPVDSSRSVLWGDARMGNIVFGEDLNVAAMLDWEGASLGPPGFDLAWWAMFDEFLTATIGVSRLGGIPDREGTYLRYRELGGGSARDLPYYDVAAPLMFALINSRLAALLVAQDVSTPEFARSIVSRTTGLIAAALDRW